MSSIQQVAFGQDPAENFRRINAAIAQANKVDGKQDTFDLPGLLAQVSSSVARLRVVSAEADQLQADLTATMAKLAQVASTSDDNALLLAALGGTLTRQRFEFLGPAARPGDCPSAFALAAPQVSLAGDGRSLPGVPASAVQSGDSGTVVRLQGPAVLVQRQAQPVEAGRVYRARYAVQRRVNPTDPSNDSVVLGVLWLDAGLNVVAPDAGTSLVEDMRDLTTALGRQERAVLLSRSPTPDTQVTAPERARYGRAYVQNYGLDGATDVEVLDLDDVTNATVLAPETADTVQRVGALESQNAGQRLGVLESNANAPNSVTFATKTDATTGAIPSTVTTVQTRGATQAGDGGDGLYKRVAGAAPAGSDSFTNQGASFVRVFTSADVLGALLSSLPTTLPPVAGRAWLNGGLLAVS